MDTAACLALTADECERIVAAFEPPVVAAGVSSFEDDYGVSVAPVRKARSRQTKFGDPAHSFRTLMDHLARQMRATMTIAGSGSCCRIAEPTPIQERALECAKTVPAS